MKEKPTENRIFTGSDKPFSAEAVRNLIKSPEFDIVQHNRIKNLVANSVTPQVAAVRRRQQMFLAIDLIRPTKDGDLLADILKCRFIGYTYKKIAKVLMKSERDLSYFSSLGKAIKFVKNAEKEGTYRVKVALAKKNPTIIIPGG